MANKLEDCALVDTIESRTPGFITQMKGKITKRYYKYTTIFKNYFADLFYIHLYKNNKSESVL